MNKKYEPDSRFVERLEWQLSSEYRRTDRLRAAPGKIAVPRTTVAIALLAGLLMTGVAVTKAADYIKDSWRKKIEMARVETDVELKRVHLESIREMASDIEMRVSNGLIREDEYQSMKLAVENAELDLHASQLNLDEVQMSGEAPRNELYAPMVSGRDFVSERLEIEIKKMNLVLEHMGIHAKRAGQLVEQDLVHRDEMGLIRSQISTQKMMIDKIRNRLDLRARFLAGEITALEVEIEDRMTGADRNLHMARSRVDSLQEELKRIEILESQGKVTHMEVIQLQYALDAAQAELKLADLEMEVLEKIR